MCPGLVPGRRYKRDLNFMSCGKNIINLGVCRVGPGKVDGLDAGQVQLLCRLLDRFERVQMRETVVNIGNRRDFKRDKKCGVA